MKERERERESEHEGDREREWEKETERKLERENLIDTKSQLYHLAFRYIIISNRRKFKHTASMGQSADQLIHTVDNSRLTINFQRVRPV